MEIIFTSLTDFWFLNLPWGGRQPELAKSSTHHGYWALRGVHWFWAILPRVVKMTIRWGEGLLVVNSDWLLWKWLPPGVGKQWSAQNPSSWASIILKGGLSSMPMPRLDWQEKGHGSADWPPVTALPPQECLPQSLPITTEQKKASQANGIPLLGLVGRAEPAKTPTLLGGRIRI